MWSVLTGPYLVATVVPSTSGSRSRCTPSRDDAGADAAVARRDLVDLVEEDDAVILGRLDSALLDHLVLVEQLVGLVVDQQRRRIP